MKSVSGKDFARLLERKGWTLRRVRGSHHIYMREGSDARISVPIHGNKALKFGLLRHLMNWPKSMKAICKSQHVVGYPYLNRMRRVIHVA